MLFVHHRYYGERYGGIKRKKSGNSRLETIDDLYSVLSECWSEDTADEKSQSIWCDFDPAAGQSDITAMVVYDLFGGTIHRIHSGEGAHYFNIIDGHIIDLAYSHIEFMRDDTRFEPNEKVDKLFCCKLRGTMKRYNLLIERISSYLSEKEAKN